MSSHEHLYQCSEAVGDTLEVVKRRDLCLQYSKKNASISQFPTRRDLHRRRVILRQKIRVQKASIKGYQSIYCFEYVLLVDIHRWRLYQAVITNVHIAGANAGTD